MTMAMRSFLLAVGLCLPAAFADMAQADTEKGGYTWPSHYDFYMPYGTRDGGPVYAKPGYKGVKLTLTCREAEGILKMRGYRDISQLTCTGNVYRFEVSRVEGRFVIDLDPRTGDIIRRKQL